MTTPTYTLLAILTVYTAVFIWMLYSLDWTPLKKWYYSKIGYTHKFGDNTRITREADFRSEVLFCDCGNCQYCSKC